jgi:hypothetical protein
MLSRFSDYRISYESEYISRDITFNETELTENISVKILFQSITAPTNTTTIHMFTENKENESIAAQTRKTRFKIELPKKAVEITKISTKFINVIISRRNSNIVYENLIEENLILSKVIIIKSISNKDKPSYEIAIANFKIFQ